MRRDRLGRIPSNSESSERADRRRSAQAGRGEAIAIAERVADAFGDPFEIAGRRFNISASIGIATNLDGSDDAEALLTHADAAQYRAKERGRNRIEVFDAELLESIQRRLGDEQELRTRSRPARSARGSNPKWS